MGGQERRGERERILRTMACRESSPNFLAFWVSSPLIKSPILIGATRFPVGVELPPMGG
jgi:hypothetical protein